jgi:hypothetical protein
MTLSQVKGIYAELRDKYEAKLSKFNVKYDSEIYLEDEGFDKVEALAESGFISLDINVFTDKIDKDNGLCFCSSVTVAKDRVDDDEILGDVKAFEESLEEFLAKLATSDSADALISAEIAESEQAAGEMMQEFERKIKSTNAMALIAVGVCVLAAAVALIVRFLI